MPISDQNTEYELIRGLINGDEHAFCTLYTTYKDRLIFWGLKFIKSREFIEDIYQDSFMVIWQNREYINPNLPFGPYIYTIVKNRILNQIAELDKNRKLKEFILSGAIDYDNRTEEHILSNDLSNMLDKAMQKLTPQQRRVFSMSREQMMSHKEIAEALGISIYTVQQHIKESLKVLREYILKHPDTYASFILLLSLTQNS